jgi:hypothetical protein
MSRTLTLQVTEVSFDFDEDDFSIEDQQTVIDSVVGEVFEVEVDDDDDDEAIGYALVEEVTDRTGWCVFGLNYRQVLDTH